MKTLFYALVLALALPIVHQSFGRVAKSLLPDRVLANEACDDEDESEDESM